MGWLARGFAARIHFQNDEGKMVAVRDESLTYQSCRDAKLF
jgi:hypothetical protein